MAHLKALVTCEIFYPVFVYLAVKTNMVTFVPGLLRRFLTTDAHPPQNSCRLSKELNLSQNILTFPSKPSNVTVLFPPSEDKLTFSICYRIGLIPKVPVKKNKLVILPKKAVWRFVVKHYALMNFLYRSNLVVAYILCSYIFIFFILVLKLCYCIQIKHSPLLHMCHNINTG